MQEANAYEPNSEPLSYHQSYPAQPEQQYLEYPAQVYPAYQENITPPLEAVPLVNNVLRDGMMVKVTVGFVRSLEDELGRL